MIINLSSNGESNHAHFTNQFTDNIIIKPNSKICLTRVSLVRDGKQTKVTIPAGLISYNYTCEARATVIGNAIEIEINSFLDNDAWQNTELVDYVFSNGDKARKMTTVPGRLISGGAIPTGTIDQSDEVRSVLWDTSTVTNGFGAGWGGNYTVITNQFNKNAFNLYSSGGNQYGKSFFIP